MLQKYSLKNISLPLNCTMIDVKRAQRTMAMEIGLKLMKDFGEINELKSCFELKIEILVDFLKNQKKKAKV